MRKFPLKKRTVLILTGFGLLMSLGLLNMKSFQFSEGNPPQQSFLSQEKHDSPDPYSSQAATSSTDPYVSPADPDDLASSYLKQASENFFYREFAKAAENYYKAIAIYEERKDFNHAAKTYVSLGDLYKMAKEMDEAENHYVRAAGYYSKVHNHWGETNAFKAIGDLYIKSEDLNAAEKWYGKALAAKGENPHMVLGRVQEAMGQLYWKVDKIPQAIGSFKQARETFVAIKYQLGYEHMNNVIKRLQRNSDSIHDHAIRSSRPDENSY